jgi:hypothetical protein
MNDKNMNDKDEEESCRWLPDSLARAMTRLSYMLRLIASGNKAIRRSSAPVCLFATLTRAVVSEQNRRQN